MKTIKVRCQLHGSKIIIIIIVIIVSCFSKIQIGFTFLVPAHPGSPGKRAVKRLCVCVCVCVCVCIINALRVGQKDDESQAQRWIAE